MIKLSCMAGIGVVFATTAAFAADLPSRRVPPAFVAPIAVPYSWTGLEFGLTTSLSFPSGQSVVTTPFGGAIPQPSPISLNKAGLDDVGGGIGYDYQFTPGTGVVVGGMVDVDYFNLHAYEDIFPDAGKFNAQTRLAYLGTANGRIGYAFDRLLVYGTGGFAFGGVHSSVNIYNAIGAPAYAGTYNNDTKTGYDFGGGVEYVIPTDSFLNNLSVEKLLGLDKKLGINLGDGLLRAEYIHYNLGSETVAVNSIGGVGGYVSTFRTQGNLVRVGLGYKFGSTPTPVVARY